MKALLTALLVGSLSLAFTVPASAHKSKKYYYTHKYKKYKTHKCKTRSVRAPYTAVDVKTKCRQVHVRVPYYNRVIRW